MRILVTNDDGIDSIGLHRLVMRLSKLGEILVVAPDTEYSGSGAAIGALHVKRPTAHEVDVDGAAEAWTISGPPALCVTTASLGAFGSYDLVVAGINPGANVGRSVYHSGTVGACLAARLRGVTGIAVSQKVDSWGVEGQGWEDALADQRWDVAAEVAAQVTSAVAEHPPATARVLNVNVPNRELADIDGWRVTRLAPEPPRSFGSARLEPNEGHQGSYTVRFDWTQVHDEPADTDAGAVARGQVSLSWISTLHHEPPDDDESRPVSRALDELLET